MNTRNLITLHERHALVYPILARWYKNSQPIEEQLLAGNETAQKISAFRSLLESARNGAIILALIDVIVFLLASYADMRYSLLAAAVGAASAYRLIVLAADIRRRAPEMAELSEAYGELLTMAPVFYSGPDADPEPVGQNLELYLAQLRKGGEISASDPRFSALHMSMSKFSLAHPDPDRYVQPAREQVTA